MRETILAVDAGGTHTRALVRTAAGRTGAGEAGPANWTTLGPEGCAGAIADAAGSALRAAGLSAHSVSRACVSLAGYYPPWHEAEAQAAIRAALPAPVLRLVPDLEAAWAGATGGEAGIVLVAGTGAVAYGRNATGRAARAGGWGPLFGDEGGGHWIGCEALRAISRALDGRGPGTSLQGAVGRAAGLQVSRSVGLQGKARLAMTYRPTELPTYRPTALPIAVEESLRAVYRDGWTGVQVAALAAAVARCAAAGDAVAAGILERAAAELGGLILAVAHRLNWRVEPLWVSAVGGVMNAGADLSEPLQRWLAAVLPSARWKAPLGSPLEGALLLAREEGLHCRTS